MYKWTKDLPKRPGLYFYRRTDVDMNPKDYSIIRVKKIRDGRGTLACFVVMECPKIRFFHCQDIGRSEGFGGLFAGPIHEPSYE